MRYCLARIVVAVSWLAAGAAGVGLAAPPTTRPVTGLRDKTPDVHVLTGARIVVRSGEVLPRAAIVIRDGVITQVGADIPPPPEARVWDREGKTIYAGFIDAYSETPVASPGGAPYWNSLISPQREVAAHYKSDAGRNKKLRAQGVTARLAAPTDGVIKGRSALVTTGDDGAERAMILPAVAQHLRLSVSNRGRDAYPNSPMGAVALARQAMLDAEWHGRWLRARQVDSTLPPPERNDALEVLQSYPGSEQLVIADALNELYLLRADQFAREFSLRLAIRGSGKEYRQLDAVRNTGRFVITPVNFPKPPNVGAAEAAMNVSLEELMHWDIAPENPARLREAGVPIALTTHNLQDVGDFLKQVRRAVQRGLSPDDALQALTEAPAKLFGASDQLGSVSRGKWANLVVTDGDVFDSKTKIVETWVAGRRYELVEPPADDPRGEWSGRAAGRKQPLVIKLNGEPSKLSGSIGGPGEQTKSAKFARVTLRDARLSAVFDAKSFKHEGMAQLTLVLDLESEPVTGLGQIVWPDGSRSDLKARRTAAAPSPKSDSDSEKKDAAKSATGTATRDTAGEAAKEVAKEVAGPPSGDSASKTDEASGQSAPASFAVNYPLGAFGREAPPEAPRDVLFQDATVWTCGKRGVLQNASVLVHEGKIAAIGRNLATPDGAVVVDARGRHITPGIIDCHSHMATDGGINESTQAVTAEVRIGDFIDCNDIDIYRQLAGGVTTANILHGSANPIGGQNQVIKLRWSKGPEQLKFSEAPAGIKFALGENVKQSNWGDEFTKRYPQTRMGVEQIMLDEFQAAREYQRAWSNWRRTGRGRPPRRDLELEAITEILDGRRWIHCHSYRQDEILALIRTLDKFKVRIGTFQHILEGYKVAPEMARHGAMGSAFSDWWAYKFEVYDAIPYNGALMHQAGVVVSFNSDDRELARRLNLEAAKATKYGAVSPPEALKFVTLNPARQLRIDHLVGSIEKGKHADLVVWSGPPLSTFSRCEQTWIDGARYFDRESDQLQRRRVREMRAVLVQKILASGEAMLQPGEKNNSEELLWPREDIFCHKHDHARGGHEAH